MDNANQPHGYLTDTLVLLAERDAIETGATVVVDGAIVSGIICPVARYDEWLRQALKRAADEGTYSAPKTSEPLTEEMAQRVRDDWAERGYADEDADYFFRTFAMRNVIVESGSAAHQISYILVNAERVSALFLGNLD